MLVNLKRPPEDRRRPRAGSRGSASRSAAVVLAEIAAILVYSAARPAPPRLPRRRCGDPAGDGNTRAVGWLLYTDYLIPFEIASMLLLVAMIGAIVLAKREI